MHVGPLPMVKALLNDTIDEAILTSRLNQAADQLLTNMFDELEADSDFDDDEGIGRLFSVWEDAVLSFFVFIFVYCFLQV